MSLIHLPRIVGRHRGGSPAQVRAELDKLADEHAKLKAHFDELGPAYNRLHAGYLALEAERDQLRVERDALAKDKAALQVHLRAANSRIANLDPFHVPAAMDHLPADGQWTPPVVPLHQAPFALGATTRPGAVASDTETTLTLRLPDAA